MNIKEFSGRVFQGDCLELMKEIDDNCIDAVITDPPYGYSFMGKDWDKAVPSVEVWRECLRVLKPGAFMFVMSAPRQDVLSQMIVRISEAGFKTDFTSIYWTYGKGFPKAKNISKAVDKRLGAEREVIGFDKNKYRPYNTMGKDKSEGWERPWMNKENKLIERCNITAPATPEAQALDGSYGGLQVKPAVEVILTAMKPLSEKTYVEQALANGKGISWLDDCRIPFVDDGDIPKPSMDVPNNWTFKNGINSMRNYIGGNQSGRFPANLLVSDDVLNDGKITKSRASGYNFEKSNQNNSTHITENIKSGIHYQDSGSYSRYFDIDRWWESVVSELPESVQKTLPFLIVTKASPGEKNKGCEEIEAKIPINYPDNTGSKPGSKPGKHLPKNNSHPCVKPIKLMAYLVTLATRKGDVVLDPFAGSGTTGVACEILNRNYILIEKEPEYCNIIESRLKVYVASPSLFSMQFQMIL